MDEIFNENDALLVMSPANRFYFCGVETSFGAVLLTAKTKYLLTDFRYALAVKRNVTDFEVIITDREKLYSDIVGLLNSAHAATVGYEDEYWSVASFKTLKKELKNFELKPISAYIRALRSVKTEKELDKIRAAQQLTEMALERVLSHVKAGVSERDIAAELSYQFIRLGADGPAFDSIVAFGENSADCHHVPGSRRLARNEIVLFDIGAKQNGYCSDMTRTFFYGEASQRFIDLHDVVTKSQQYVLKHLKAGVTGANADTMAREFLKANGYEKEFGHTLGHGVGIDIHEGPMCSQSNTAPLPENAVVTVEPGVYIPDFGGVRMEDMVVIKKGGIENLTKYNKSYII